MMILIVDDNPDIASLFADALETAGHKSVTALSGEDGLRYLRNGKYDLALVDLDLSSGLNGTDMIARARAAGVTTPAIAVSGKMPLVEPVGFAEVFAKPVRISALLDLVAQYVPA